MTAPTIHELRSWYQANSSKKCLRSEANRLNTFQPTANVRLRIKSRTMNPTFHSTTLAMVLRSGASTLSPSGLSSRGVGT
jgi:hypothetical protein